MNNKFDVIVVGAGNGGLMAAATTAKEGLKTLLLEKHNLPGGCATSFRRGRFEFEPSLHELCSVGTKENPSQIYKLFDDLGVKINWEYEDKVFRTIVKGDDGYDVTLKAGIENFIKSIDDAVPGSEKSVREFLGLNKKIKAALDYLASVKGVPNVFKILTQHSDFLRVASHSVEEVMDSLSMPKKAQNIINTYWGYLGVPTDELNAMHFLSMIHSYIVEGAAMPHHRSHELSVALVDIFEKSGGQIRYNSEVTKFLYNEDGRVIGVVANGEEFFADEVISNVIPDNVFNMSDETKIPKRQMKLANARDFGISVATIYVGLDCTAEELGIEDYTIFIQNNADPRTQYNTRKTEGFYIVNCLNNAIPDSSPDGTCTLFFTLPVFGSDLPEDLTPQGYKKYKNDLAEKFIKDCEEVLNISIIPHIEEISVATPVTFARYLGTPEGTIYGYKNSGWDNVVLRTTFEALDYKIPGLSFCGGHYTNGDGYSSAYTVGSIVAKRVVERLKGGNA